MPAEPTHPTFLCRQQIPAATVIHDTNNEMIESNQADSMLRYLHFEEHAMAWRAANPSSFGYEHEPVHYWPQQQLRVAGTDAIADQPPSIPRLQSRKSTRASATSKLLAQGPCAAPSSVTSPPQAATSETPTPGAAHNPMRLNMTAFEKLQAEIALKRWILTVG